MLHRPFITIANLFRGPFALCALSLSVGCFGPMPSIALSSDTADASSDSATTSDASTRDAACVPQPEICNGLDDDCDGVVDDIVRSCGMTGGACQQGSQRCVGGSWTSCTGVVDPSPEACDGLDNDCDGQVDEDLGSSSCGVGACARTMPNCMNGRPQRCMSGTPSPETCNNLDDDCDGTIDNGVTRSCYTGPTGTQGVGVCRAGTQTCSGGVWSTTCVGAVTPSTEVCNSRDDNCDGTADDGPFACRGSMTTSCNICPGVARTLGTRTCNASCAWDQCIIPGVLPETIPVDVANPRLTLGPADYEAVFAWSANAADFTSSAYQLDGGGIETRLFTRTQGVGCCNGCRWEEPTHTFRFTVTRTRDGGCPVIEFRFPTNTGSCIGDHGAHLHSITLRRVSAYR